MKPRFLLLSLLTLVLPLNAQTADPQSWIANDGRVIQAKFIKLDGESVVIEKDGKQFALPFSKLKAESVEQAKKLGGVVPVVAADAKTVASTFDPSGTDPIKPLWILPQTDLIAPAGRKGPLGFGTEQITKSGNLVFSISGTPHGAKDKNPGIGAALVDGKTGKLIWRTFLKESRKGWTEWGRGCIEGPDGHLVLCSVAFGEGEGLIHLRRLDRKTGQVLTQMQMAINDPASSDGANGANLNTGNGGSYLMGVRDSTVLLANGYFAAAVDMEKGQVVSFSKVPKTMDGAEVHGGGTFAEWMVYGPDGKQLIAAIGEEPQVVPIPKPGWTLSGAGSQGGWASPLMNVVCEAPDKKGWAVGAYDPVKKIWAWTKTAEELVKAVPGPSKRITKVGSPNGTLFLDADTGELRHRSERKDGDYTLLPDGSYWSLTQESEAKMGRPNEAVLVNARTGKTEVKLSRTTSFPESYKILFRPDGDVLMAAVNAGSVEMEVISASRKTLFPPRKVNAALPSPPKSVSLQTALTGALLEIQCEDDSTHYCVIPLPEK